ncbi:MAG: YrzE family protein [Actinomycetota bacterium]|nr:YrzE family protein [Actinomycetota bacterium]
MFGKDRTTAYGDRETVVRETPISARGGVSLGTILTGALVAIGAFFLLSTIVGAVLSQTGVSAEELARGDAVDAGVAGGVALLVAWFLSFTWGGYTAGRMGRGSGFLNGLLVPIGVILLAALVGAIAWALGSSEGWSLPSPTQQLQIDGEYTSVDYGIGLILVTLGVMLLGSIFGGIAGARWHTKLERRVEGERHESLVQERREESKQIDLNEREETARREHAAAAARAKDSAHAERSESDPPRTERGGTPTSRI